MSLNLSSIEKINKKYIRVIVYIINNLLILLSYFLNLFNF